MKEIVQPLSVLVWTFKTVLAPLGVIALTTWFSKSYLENRNDLRKRKIEAYTDFLEQANKVFQHEIVLTLDIVETYIKWHDKTAPEIAKLERCIWLIRVLGSEEVALQADQIHIYLLSAHVQLLKGNSHEAKEKIAKAEDAVYPLTEAMREDIQQWEFSKWI
jgi:hypothetical protein